MSKTDDLVILNFKYSGDLYEIFNTTFGGSKIHVCII